MDYPSIFLFVAIILNLIMSVLVTLRGWKNHVNKYFGLMTFFNVLWAFGLLIFKLSNNPEIVEFFASFVYFAALLVVLNLFYFTFYFPFQSIGLLDKFQKGLSVFIYLFSLYFLFFYHQFIVSVDVGVINLVVYESVGYLIFTIILSILMLLSIAVLIVKYIKADKIFKTPLLLVLIAVTCGVLAGSYFNLYAMYFDDFENYHLGPLFTLLINFVAFYLIFFEKKQ